MENYDSLFVVGTFRRLRLLVVVVFIVNIVIVFDDLTFSKLPNSFKENNEKPFNFSYKENIHFEERKKKTLEWENTSSHLTMQLRYLGSLFFSHCVAAMWMDGWKSFDSNWENTQWHRQSVVHWNDHKQRHHNIVFKSDSIQSTVTELCDSIQTHVSHLILYA